MSTEAFLTAALGGLVGSVLGVWAAFYLERRRDKRRQIAAGRAVALELMTNAAYLEMALKRAPVQPLIRETFDRQLSDLALLLTPDDFRTVSGAYTRFAAVNHNIEIIRA